MNRYEEALERVVQQAVDALMEFEREFNPEPDRAAIKARFQELLPTPEQFEAEFGAEETRHQERIAMRNGQ